MIHVQEGPWLLETWRIDKLTHLPSQYQKSPLKTHGPEFYWKDVPQSTIKELYRKKVKIIIFVGQYDIANIAFRICPLFFTYANAELLTESS